MKLDLERVRANVREATTEDLLDRATVYRGGMEPEALEIIDAELRARGVTPEERVTHECGRGVGLVKGPDGLPRACAKCGRPATWQGWTWGRLWWLLPVFPRWCALCDEHRPQGGPGEPAHPCFSSAFTSASWMRLKGLSSCALSQLRTAGV